MNTPGKKEGNWKWRFTKDMLSENIEKMDMLGDLARIYGRVSPPRSGA
jgi:4-alpha-glucanotransferase